MRPLLELLGSPDGRRFLEGKGVFMSREAFVEHLEPPAHEGLREMLSIETLPVYAAHQLRADYPDSVASKLRAAGALQAADVRLTPVLVWLDLDRVGADRRNSGVHLRGRGGSLQLRFASRRHDEKEVRFVPLEPPALEEALRRLSAWARQHGSGPVDRLARLTETLRNDAPATLADLNLALTSFLVREHLSLTAPSVLISELCSRGLLARAIEDTLNGIDDVVTVFNAAIEALLAADVDPQVRPLAPDYLPLHYSCDRDDRRCKLRHERRGADHFAVTTCACGATYRFHLGTDTLSMSEVAATGRWSTDVTLPVYLNDLASGVVGGKSSLLYGLVLNEVLEKVLARRPVPMLVPENLPDVLGTNAERVERAGGNPPGGSLLADYLTGR
jgi:hypothetical protein